MLSLYDWEWAVADKGEVTFFINGLVSNVVVRRAKLQEPPPVVKDKEKKVA